MPRHRLSEEEVRRIEEELKQRNVLSDEEVTSIESQLAQMVPRAQPRPVESPFPDVSERFLEGFDVRPGTVEDVGNPLFAGQAQAELARGAFTGLLKTFGLTDAIGGEFIAEGLASAELKKAQGDIAGLNRFPGINLQNIETEQIPRVASSPGELLFRNEQRPFLERAGVDFLLGPANYAPGIGLLPASAITRPVAAVARTAQRVAPEVARGARQGLLLPLGMNIPGEGAAFRGVSNVSPVGSEGRSPFRELLGQQDAVTQNRYRDYINSIVDVKEEFGEWVPRYRDSGTTLLSTKSRRRRRLRGELKPSEEQTRQLAEDLIGDQIRVQPELWVRERGLPEDLARQLHGEETPFVARGVEEVPPVVPEGGIPDVQRRVEGFDVIPVERREEAIVISGRAGFEAHQQSFVEFENARSQIQFGRNVQDNPGLTAAEKRIRRERFSAAAEDFWDEGWRRIGVTPPERIAGATFEQIDQKVFGATPLPPPNLPTALGAMPEFPSEPGLPIQGTLDEGLELQGQFPRRLGEGEVSPLSSGQPALTESERVARLLELQNAPAELGPLNIPEEPLLGVARQPLIPEEPILPGAGPSILSEEEQIRRAAAIGQSQLARSRTPLGVQGSVDIPDEPLLGAAQQPLIPESPIPAGTGPNILTPQQQQQTAAAIGRSQLSQSRPAPGVQGPSGLPPGGFGATPFQQAVMGNAGDPWETLIATVENAANIKGSILSDSPEMLAQVERAVQLENITGAATTGIQRGQRVRAEALRGREQEFGDPANLLNAQSTQADIVGFSDALRNVIFDPITQARLKDPQIAQVVIERASDTMHQVLLGNVPTSRELASLRGLLDQILPNNQGKRFVQAVGKFRGKRATVWANLMDALNMPRAIITAFDLSAPLRQGFPLIVSRPGAAKNAFADMMRAWVREKNAVAIDNALRADQFYTLFTREHGLFQAERSAAGGAMLQAEEAFMSRIATKIPGIRISERAYVSFLNKLRYNTMKQTYLEKVKALNPNVKAADIDAELVDFETLVRPSAEELNKLASFINAATGRGSLGPVEHLSPILNVFFFSPKMLTGRIEFIPRAIDIAIGSKGIRRTIAKDAVGGFIVAGGILGMLDASGLADVEWDPRSSDFGQVRIGPTRIDFLGGFRPLMRLMVQLTLAIPQARDLVGADGNVKALGTGNISRRDSLDILFRFARSKLSPSAGFGVDVAFGEDFLGNDLLAPQERFGVEVPGTTNLAIERFVPLVMQDIAEALDEDGARGGALAASAFFGTGVSSFQTVEDIAQRDFKKSATEMERYEQRIAQDILEKEGDRTPNDFQETEARRITNLMTIVDRDLTGFDAANEYFKWDTFARGRNQGLDPDHEFPEPDADDVLARYNALFDQAKIEGTDVIDSEKLEKLQERFLRQNIRQKDFILRNTNLRPIPQPVIDRICGRKCPQWITRIKQGQRSREAHLARQGLRGMVAQSQREFFLIGVAGQKKRSTPSRPRRRFTPNEGLFAPFQ